MLRGAGRQGPPHSARPLYLAMSVESLYIHIPFCHARCTYCDFDTKAACGSQLLSQGNAYVQKLLRRLRDADRAGVLERVETVYIGGGTPTVLGERLVDIVREICGYCNPVEFTCEANPESFTPELAFALAHAGVTRVSLGVQSLDDDELALLGRIHSSSQAERAVGLARSCGFSTSVDLICGLSGQTMASWEKTLDRACALETDHVSVYPLMIEDGTPLSRAIEAGRVAEPDEDLQAEMMDVARSVLTGRGLERYEVASYARAGKECRHNIAYWTGKSYLGLGRSAASMFSSKDYGACAKLFDALDVPSGASRIRIVQLDDEGTAFDVETLSSCEALAEDLMLGARMSRGISYDLLRRAAAVIPPSRLLGTLKEAVDLGLLSLSDSWDSLEAALSCDVSRSGPCAMPTRQGWLMGNQLYGMLWDLHKDARFC